MLEAYIQDQSVYDQLKGRAVYYCDLTHVCQFPDSISKTLDKFSISYRRAEEAEKVPYITDQGKVLYLHNASPSLMAYLGMQDYSRDRILYADFENALWVLQHGVVENRIGTGSKFYPLTLRSKIKELITVNVPYKIGKAQKRLTDYADPDSTIAAGLMLPKIRRVTSDMLNITLRVISGISNRLKERDGRTLVVKEFECISESDQSHYCPQFYGWINPLYNSIFFPGNTVRIGYTNRKQEAGEYVITSSTDTSGNPECMGAIQSTRHHADYRDLSSSPQENYRPGQSTDHCRSHKSQWAVYSLDPLSQRLQSILSSYSFQNIGSAGPNICKRNCCLESNIPAKCRQSNG